MTSPQTSTSPGGPARWGTRIALAALLLLAGLILEQRLAERGLPHHDGHSARWWFARYCRTGDSHGRSHKHGEAVALECQLAFLAMGSNVVPYLVREATTFRTVSPLQTNLYLLTESLPDWAGGGLFFPRSRATDMATSLLQELRPDAAVLLPLLRDVHRDTNTLPHRQSVFLASAFRDVPDEVVAWLSGILTNATEELWTRQLAAQSVWWLGAGSSNLYPAVHEYLRQKPDSRLFSWLGRLGPRAAPSIPFILPHLDATNSWERIHAALALISIDPTNAAAARVLLDAAEGRGDPRAKDNLKSALVRAPLRPIPVLEDFVIEAAYGEVLSWSPTSLSFLGCYGLERLAPRRAAALYREVIQNNGASAAAGRLLILDRSDVEAAGFLMRRAASKVAVFDSPIVWLSEVSSSDHEAIALLEKLAADRDPRVADEARYSLARIRVRDVQNARGIVDPWQR